MSAALRRDRLRARRVHPDADRGMLCDDARAAGALDAALQIAVRIESPALGGSVHLVAGGGDLGYTLPCDTFNVATKANDVGVVGAPVAWRVCHGA